MTRNQIWAVVIGGAGIAVAAVVAISLRSGHCSGSECQIRVEVKDCAKGDIVASPDTARITVAKHIKWTIDTPGYLFTSNGIQISGTDFTADPGLTGQGDKWRIRDAHNILGETKYTIEVKTSAGVTCTKKDPFIVNE